MIETFPHAHQTIDKFHVMQLLGDAVDETRRDEQKKAPQLKKSRYLWLCNERDLSQEQKNRLATFALSTHKTTRAYQLLLAFQEFWQGSRRVAELHLSIWCNWATHRSQGTAAMFDSLPYLL